MSSTGTPWVDGLTIGQVLTATAQRFGGREALVFPQLSRRWTWRQFADDVDAAARGLLSLGIRTGEHVALWATNVPQWVLLQFATARIGAVLVNINPAYRAHELAYVLDQADIAVLFLTDLFKSSRFFDILADARTQVPCLKLRHVVSLQDTKPDGALTWQDQLGITSTVVAISVQGRTPAV